MKKCIYADINAVAIKEASLKELVNTYIENGIDLNIKKLVPNKVTAFNIAIAVLSNIYGENQLESESPFNVYLRDSIWVVYGTQKHQKGGFSYIEIDARDGRVLKISHEE